MTADTQAPAPAPTAPGTRHQHRKGGTYTVLGTAKVQTDTPLSDYDEVVVYQSEADRLMWARPVAEFEDGRFTQIAPAPTADMVLVRAIPLEWDHREEISEAFSSFADYRVFAHGSYMPGRWTTDSAIGRDFPSREAAIAAVEAYHEALALEAVELAASPTPSPVLVGEPIGYLKPAASWAEHPTFMSIQAWKDHSCMQTVFTVPVYGAPLAGEAGAVEALRKIQSLLIVDRHDDGRVAGVGYEGYALRDIVSVLDAALSLTPPKAETETAFETIPVLPKCGRYLAQDNKGQWHYLNHAHSWCSYQGPSAPAETASERERLAKPLVWQRDGSSKPMLGLEYLVSLRRDPMTGYDEQWLAQLLSPNQRIGGFHASKEEARAACYEDACQRLRAALSTEAGR